MQKLFLTPNCHPFLDLGQECHAPAAHGRRADHMPISESDQPDYRFDNTCCQWFKHEGDGSVTWWIRKHYQMVTDKIIYGWLSA